MALSNFLQNWEVGMYLTEIWQDHSLTDGQKMDIDELNGKSQEHGMNEAKRLGASWTTSTAFADGLRYNTWPPKSKVQIDNNGYVTSTTRYL